MIYDEWVELTNRFQTIELDEFIVMPNHFHGIIKIKKIPFPVGASLVDAPMDAPVNQEVDIPPPGNSQPDARNRRVVDACVNTDINNYGDIGMGARVGAGTRPAPTRTTCAATCAANVTLGDIIGALKSITTNKYIYGVKNKNWCPFNKRLWQRNYYEHIVRDENDLNRIRNYIIRNPFMWSLKMKRVELLNQSRNDSTELNFF